MNSSSVIATGRKDNFRTFSTHGSIHIEKYVVDRFFIFLLNRFDEDKVAFLLSKAIILCVFQFLLVCYTVD